MVKQKYLFHASPRTDLIELAPQKKTHPVGIENGPVVFATDNLAFSTMFLVAHDDSWANGGAFGEQLYFVVSDEKRFRDLDKGGCVYLVPSRGFTKYNGREYFTNKAVRTSEKICYSSGLMAMIINDVQVYFVNKDRYSEIQNSSDHGLSILNSLESENERLGFKIEKLDFYMGSKKAI